MHIEQGTGRRCNSFEQAVSGTRPLQVSASKRLAARPRNLAAPAVGWEEPELDGFNSMFGDFVDAFRSFDNRMANMQQNFEAARQQVCLETSEWMGGQHPISRVTQQAKLMDLQAHERIDNTLAEIQQMQEGASNLTRSRLMSPHIPFVHNFLVFANLGSLHWPLSDYVIAVHLKYRPCLRIP